MELSNNTFIVDKCQRESIDTSNYCQDILSNDHLKEHVEQCQLESLCIANDIHQVSDRLNKIIIDEPKFVKNLEEWRNEAHELIDKFCKLKHDEYILIIKEEIEQSQERISLLSCDQDASEDYIEWVKYTIQSINEQLNQLEQIQPKFSRLKLDESLIDIRSIKYKLKDDLSPLKDLFSSSLSSNELTYNSLSMSTSNFELNQSENKSLFDLKSPKEKVKFQCDYWYSLSRNETHIILCEKSNLYLIDKYLKISNKKSNLNISIKDICWSKILSRFILITSTNIYTIDDKLKSLELSPINLINNYKWERGTCSDTSLFISTFGDYPFILEYDLLPTIQLNKRWQTSIICQNNEIINDIKSQDIDLGLIIQNDITNQTRLEIRSIKSFQTIFSIDLGQGWSYRCSPYTNRSWIVVDAYFNRFIKINNNGTIDNINSYPTKLFNIIYWYDNQIAIRTSKYLNIHHCQ
ncbi:unnamed protein product [Rotaria sp. Silwood1]|nr:unnamed protein product [Rotaria sp. Silwood1]CAF1558111.1 unnamed protein product [Rotaria sp. Silwood1]CAF4921941.1 unnamed protein product [Rotaria sp. Silwood1]